MWLRRVIIAKNFLAIAKREILFTRWFNAETNKSRLMLGNYREQSDGFIDQPAACRGSVFVESLIYLGLLMRAYV